MIHHTDGPSPVGSTLMGQAEGCPPHSELLTLHDSKEYSSAKAKEELLPTDNLESLQLVKNKT